MHCSIDAVMVPLLFTLSLFPEPRRLKKKKKVADRMELSAADKRRRKITLVDGKHFMFASLDGTFHFTVNE